MTLLAWSNQVLHRVLKENSMRRLPVFGALSANQWGHKLFLIIIL